MPDKPQTRLTFVNQHPLIPFVISFVFGIIAASYIWLTDEAVFPFLILSMLILIIGIVRRWRFNLMIICLIFFMLGAVFSGEKMGQIFPQNHIKTLTENDAILSDSKYGLPGTRIEGTLYRTPERFQDRTRLYLNAERIFINDQVISVTGKVLITVGSPSAGVKYGDRVRLIARLRIPQNFGNPGEFDYAGNLARDDIHVTGYARNERWVAVIDSGQKQGLRNSVEETRNTLRDFIDESGAENTAIIKALLLGEKGEIPAAVKNSFVATGTAHILAISGLHIGIIAFVAYWICLKLFKQSERIMLAFDVRRLAALSSIMPVLLYGAVAGFSVSTQRAVLMVIVFVIAVAAGRERGFYNALAAAAFVILIVSPLSVYAISFQLSFSSVLAIIYLVPKFQSIWHNEGKGELIAAMPEKERPITTGIKNHILILLTVSVAASLGTAPFAAYHFHRVSVTGALANLLIVPLMGFIAVPLGLTSAFISFFCQPVAQMSLGITDIILKASIWIADIFAQLPYSSVFTTTPTILEAVLFYLLIICIAEFKKTRLLRYGLLFVSFAIICNHLYWYHRLNYNPNLRVTFISIGQGDSALVEFPYGKRMLIDGGGFYSEDFDAGERVIAPFLWKNKIDTIDYLVLSHPQTDHAGGLGFIAERFGVKEFRWNGDAGKDSAFRSLMQTIGKKKIRHAITDASNPPLTINGVVVKFLHPPRKSRLSINNNSLTVKLEHGDISFLFPGDIEDEGEAAILRKGPDIKSTVLKVPHHGSKTSSSIDFLNHVDPQLAIISAGHLNPFGFPHREILKRYEELKIRVLRTDVDGAVTVESDGTDIRISMFKKSWIDCINSC